MLGEPSLRECDSLGALSWSVPHRVGTSLLMEKIFKPEMDRRQSTGLQAFWRMRGSYFARDGLREV